MLREADRSVRQNIRRVETFESGDAPQTPPRSRGLRRRVAALAEERDALLANAEKRISSLTEQLARVTRERDAARPVVETRGRATQTKVYGLQQRPRSAPPSPRGSSDDEDRGKWRRAEDELKSLRRMLEGAAASEARAVASLKRDLAAAQAELDVVADAPEEPHGAGAGRGEKATRGPRGRAFMCGRSSRRSRRRGAGRRYSEKDLAATKASLEVHREPADTSVVKQLRDALNEATSELNEARSSMKAQKNTADELEACRRAHAAEKQAAEELRGTS